MARATLASKDREIAALRERIAHLEKRQAIAAPAPAHTADSKPCARCLGTGEYEDLGECLRCSGSGVDPGKTAGRADFAIRQISRVLGRRPTASVERPRTKGVLGMSEERKAFFAAHPHLNSATPAEIREWWTSAHN